ncbi:hypothetical protein Gogos_022207 [Gossypium gossypioides]|uniref:RNase H type-1 domain-containing protein n=1 Tax=Gossypium gossypioides TaxID=34282 RepID=A0A7J9CYB6_GOSGO|nr:hypothetical protein [Gossypium gossypioides]
MAKVTWSASVGGVLRDQDGNWILGFNCYLGNCTPFDEELWGILDGLLILLNKGYKRATIQTDNLEVVKALTVKGVGRFSLAWKSSLQIFDVPPNDVLEVLQQDKVCGAFEQLI